MSKKKISKIFKRKNSNFLHHKRRRTKDSNNNEKEKITSNKNSKTSEGSQLTNSINKEIQTSKTPLSCNDSLTNDLLKQKEINKDKKLYIFKIKKGVKIKSSLDEVKKLFNIMDFKSLSRYRFPYMSEAEFNNKIYFLKQNHFRKLIFYCPICEKNLKHYSMDFHIFEYHFEHIDDFLNIRQIAHGCSKLLENEYKKIKKSLLLFSELAELFMQCSFIGYSNWRSNTNSYIRELKYLNISKLYFSNSNKEIKEILKMKLPVNKSRAKKDKYE